MTLASVRTTKTVLRIFVLLSAVFYLDASGSFLASTALSELSGYVLIVEAVLALYLSASTIVNETWDRTVLPAP